jgi:guanine deaminase
MVVATNDPTAHAEILAIRRASKELNSFDLSSCILFTTCEPCPMCFAAIHWARIPRMYYGCTREDAAEIGFSDKYIYDVIQGTAEKETVRRECTCRDECRTAFHRWSEKEDKVLY